MQKQLIKKTAAWLVFFGIAASVGYYWFSPTPSLISAFNDARDTQDIVKLMKDNWYLLISSPDFSTEFMLRERAPSQHTPRYFGKLRINVLRKDGQLVGFTTYYKKSEYQGHIFILAVDEKFRRQGYAKQLVQHSIDELKKMGTTWIQLVTREENNKARAMYKKLGFTQYLIEGGFVYFRK